MSNARKVERPIPDSNGDSVSAYLSSIPIDDEPMSEDDVRALAEAQRAYLNRETVAADEAKQETLAVSRPTASA